MESTPPDILVKYHKLAAEYSKLRLQAQVLKKGVLDEQARSNGLTDSLKECEQRLRKSDMEIESLTFRNQQLMKRIGVLQDELDIQSKQKSIKGKLLNKDSTTNQSTVLDEELQNKILENARLLTMIAEKDLEISNLSDRLSYVESQVTEKKSQEIESEQKYKIEITKLKNKNSELLSKIISLSNNPTPEPTFRNGDNRSEVGSLIGSEDAASSVGDSQLSEQLTQARQLIVSLKQELEQCKAQHAIHQYSNDDDIAASACSEEDKQKYQFTEILGAVTTNSTGDNLFREQKIKEYFMQRINELVADKEHAQSISDSYAVECNSLQTRIEEAYEEKFDIESKLKSSNEILTKLQEELSTTSHNYETQLSTMSEHLANMNDKLTQQCDEIQELKRQLKEKKQKSK